MSRSLIPNLLDSMGSSKQHNTIIAANTEVTRVAGYEKPCTTQDYILCAQLLQKDHKYCASLQIVHYRSPEAHVHK